MEEFNIKKVSIILLVVLIIIVAFYFITVLVLDNKKAKEKENTYTAIQYDEIIVGNMYNQKENEYYILATLGSDTNKETYISNYQNYSKEENAIKTYTINLDSGFNKKYIGENSDFSLKYPIFSKSTLLKIVDKEIKEIYEAEEINQHLNTIMNEG